MTKKPEDLVADIQSAIDTMKVDNKAILDNLKQANEATGKDAQAAAKKADDLADKLAGVAASIVEMEQKLADNVMTGKAAIETLGQSVIKSDAFKNFAAGKTGKMRIEANTITGQSGSPAANDAILTAADRLSGIVGGSFRTLRILDVVPQGTTTSNSVEYTRELSFTNAAAETAQGASKPESTLTFELASTPVATIAHFLKVSKQVLDDAPALQSYIDTRLRYGVELRYENAILAGVGTGQAIGGMNKSGNHTAYTPLTGNTALDTLNHAIQTLAVADYAPTAVILNPADWGAIERLKDTTNQYIIGNPASSLVATLWGLPVVVTNAQTSGKFTMANMPMAYQVWNRQGTAVEIFEQDDVNVQKNLLTVRAEKRGALAVYRVASALYGSLTV